MKHKTLTWGMVLVMIWSIVGAASAWASDGPVFTLEVSRQAPGKGQELQVTVVGEQLKDLYGFELQISYDTGRLRFKSASPGWKGLSVPAMVKDGVVTFAHTKIGAVPGVTGNANLATLTFEALAEGETSLKLERLKLVDSQVASTVVTPGTQSTLAIGPEEAGTSLNFKDIAGHWAEAKIKRGVALGIVNGYSDGSFKPEGKVTRAEFTAMLIRALKKDSQGTPAVTFSDYDRIPDWAKPSVTAAAALGLVTGYEDGTFRSEQLITRAEMAVMIMRQSGIALKEDRTPAFADAADIPDWAAPSIAAAADAGLIHGRDNNRYEPMEYTTRAEAVTLILALLDRLASE